MKKILWLALLGLFFIFPRLTFAAPTYTFTGSASGTITIVLSSSASFHVVFPVVKNTSYYPGVCVTNDSTVPCGSTAVYDTSTAALSGKGKAIPNVYNKAQVWDYTLQNLDPTKKYYLIILGSGGYKNPETHEFFTGTEKLSDKPILNSTQDGNDVIVSTKIDIAKYPYYQELSASLVYSTSKDLSNPIAGGAIAGRQGPDANSAVGINTISSQGAFFWRLANLAPSTIYYFQVTISSKLDDSIKSDIDSFNSSNGVTIAPGSAAEQADLNKRSYTLLSGFPGFSVLPDPDLCAQQRAAGQHPKFCDINDVLNYGMQLLIGLAGVMLVMRLMFEGYQYMVTDVPFLKASAKAGFFTALLGLLLALSSYLILNTINPKLVSESINVQQLAIGVTQPDTDTVPIADQQNITLSNYGPAGACTAELRIITVQQSKFIVCSSYNGIPVANNLQSMLTAAYAQKIILKGGGFRTKAQQVALRVAHCNGDTINPNAACNPQTALPGHSNHESGLAFDFNCNGGSAYQIKNTNCFTWLQSNAAAYGFKNLPSEPWHWSWNGQ